MGGGHGGGSRQSGRDAPALVLPVPPGVQVLDDSGSTLLADLVRDGQSFLLARGGRGGIGNTRFRTSVRRAPRRTIAGGAGEEKSVWLKLKMIADAGLVGLPNSGKSTLLAAMTAARPRIAPYPFTTLGPVPGRVGAYEDLREPFTLADTPGLVAGSSTGTGIRFFGHLERCPVLLHLVDASGDPARDWRIIRNELSAWGAGLDRRPVILVLGKTDLATPEAVSAARRQLENLSGQDVLTISALTGSGMALLEERLRGMVGRLRPEPVTGASWHPLGNGD